MNNLCSIKSNRHSKSKTQTFISSNSTPPPNRHLIMDGQNEMEKAAQTLMQPINSVRNRTANFKGSNLHRKTASSDMIGAKDSAQRGKVATNG